MNISQRLRTCAKHTGLDAVIELPQEAADEIDALQARAQVQGEVCPTCGETEPYTGSCGTSNNDTKALCKQPLRATQAAQVLGELSVDQMREMLSVHKLAIVPMRATHAMPDAMSDDDWQWSDLLAAAEAITEDEHDWIDATPQPAQAAQAEVTEGVGDDNN